MMIVPLRMEFTIWDEEGGVWERFMSLCELRHVGLFEYMSCGF